MGDQWVLVGSGVYLADAPKAAPVGKKMTAPELMTLVREAAAVFEQRGEAAYDEFRKPGSKWFRDDVYFFVWTMHATRVFHAADPGLEGRKERDLKDIQGRPFGQMFLDAGGSPSGEGWVHYMYPEPGSIFPMWKSSFIKRVRFPSGKEHIIGCGIYNMQMDKAFITDLVNRAAGLIEKQGKDAFGQLRDRQGPFVFMDTYVFVDSPEGTELVNAGQPSLEGKNLMGVRDINGKAVVRDEIALAMKEGSGWVDLYWYKPGQNTPARKQTFVRTVQSGQDTYIVGAGIYPEE
jgi:signal transduction histidine kinase